ncbi:MAG TPA: GNAT family N-acetyltransferase, partial [Anaerolineae bacterium]
MNITPITLEGAHVRLEPLALKHADDLFAVSRSPEIWELLIAAPIQTLDEMRAWIEKAEKQTA